MIQITLITIAASERENHHFFFGGGGGFIYRLVLYNYFVYDKLTRLSSLMGIIGALIV